MAWLSLDEGDSDLPRFLGHVVAAIQTTDPGLGVDAQDLLQGDVVPTEAVLVSLVNDLDTAAEPTVLALDDYHVIEDAGCPRGGVVPARHLPAAGRPSRSPPGRTRRCRSPGCGPAGSCSSCAPPTSASRADEADALPQPGDGARASPPTTSPPSRRGPRAGRPACSSPRSRLALSRSTTSTAFVDAFTGSHRFVLDYLRRGGARSQPAARRAHVPARHLGPGPADRPAVRRR